MALPNWWSHFISCLFDRILPQWINTITAKILGYPQGAPLQVNRGYPRVEELVILTVSVRGMFISYPHLDG